MQVLDILIQNEAKVKLSLCMPLREGIRGNEGTAPPILKTVGVGDQLHSTERAPSTHRLAGWVGPRGIQGILNKR